MYRGSAKKVLRAADNQLKVSTPSGGLKMFIRVPTDATWHDKNWERWPYIALNLDHASENFCAYNYFDKKLGGNADLFGDNSHGGNRDTFLSLDRAGLKQFIQVMMVSWNLPHGPADDDSWSNMLDEVLAYVKQVYNKGNLPALFLAMAPKMIEMLRRSGFQFPGEDDIEWELWCYVIDDGLRRKAGSKVTACRFQGHISTAQANINCWWADRFIRTAKIEYIHI